MATRTLTPIPRASIALPNIQLFHSIAAVGLLLLFAYIGMLQMMTPSVPTNTPAADAFSSSRALQLLRKIARAPHPIGTSAHDDVRDFLLAELKALGLEPSLQPEQEGGSHSGSTVGKENIVAEFAGSAVVQAGGKALLLTAHYDSVSAGPGAADDGASVAAILETIRALKAGPPLSNDVIIVFTDGEEPRSMGAKALILEPRLRERAGLVLNFEFRGNSGPMLMFETSNNNGRLISGMAQAVAQPRANSLLSEVYRRMPNGTDLTVFMRAGIPGMNFAAADNPISYHSDLDRPELLNPGTLQHEGDIMLAMTRHFGTQPLTDLAAPDHVYFDFPGLGLVHYPSAWALPLSGSAALLLGAVLLMGRRAFGLRIGRSLLGAMLFMLLVMLAAAVCHVAWMGIYRFVPAVHATGTPYNGGWYWLAMAALAVALFVLLQTALQRWISSWEFGMGAALIWIVLLTAASITMPGTAFLLLWPLIGILMSWLIQFSPWGQTATLGRSTVLLTLGAAPGVILIAPQYYLLLLCLGTFMIAVPIVVLSLLLGLLAPLSSRLTQRLMLPGLAIAAIAACLVGAQLTAGFDAQHPEPSSLSLLKYYASGTWY